MDSSELLFWNVDTQVDFVEPHGKLYVLGAEKLKPIWNEITQFAIRRGIRIVNTADFHRITSKELSDSPDFVESFPQHCMGGSEGAHFIIETDPVNPIVFDWDKEYALKVNNEHLKTARNILIRKDAFDVFTGNQNTDALISLLDPKRIFVYGVTTNVCVDKAVCGLAERGYDVYVFVDAIKELPEIPLPFSKWKELGVGLIEFKDIEKYI